MEILPGTVHYAHCRSKRNTMKTQHNMQVPDEITFTYKDLANYLKCSRFTIYNRVKDGTLPHLKVGRKTVFVKADIDRLFKVPETVPVENKKGTQS